MSRGPGKIERAIAALLDGSPDMAVTAEELAERVYGTAAVEHKHIVSVLRALRRLGQRRPDIDKTWGRDRKRLHEKGGRTVWFNRRNVQSYGLMMLKTRYCAYRINDAEKQLSYLRHIRSVETEAELRAMLAPGGRYHRYIQPGGEWYRSVHEAAKAPEASGPELGKQQRLLLKALVALGDPGEDQAWSMWAVLYKAWHDPEFQGAIAERVRRWHVDEAARAAAETPRVLHGSGSELDAFNKEDDGRIVVLGERLLERRQIRGEMKDASRAFSLLEKRGLVARSGSRGQVSVTVTAAGRALLQSG